jgi:hypothetical protein
VSLNSMMWICRRHGIRSSNPPTHRPLFSENISPEGYVIIRVRRVSSRSAPQQDLMFKHRWLWEQQNGPIPPGHKLKCLDGDRQNCDPSNWECVPNAMLGRLRARNFENAPSILKPTILAVARLEHAAATAGKRDQRRRRERSG